MAQHDNNLSDSEWNIHYQQIVIEDDAKLNGKMHIKSTYIHTRTKNITSITKITQPHFYTNFTDHVTALTFTCSLAGQKHSWP